MIMDICISGFDLCNSLILYPYLCRYFHLLLKICFFCLLIQTDCQPSYFQFSLWGLQILHFYLNSVPLPPHSNLCILLSTLLTIFLIFLPAILKPSSLGFDLFLSGVPIWNVVHFFHSIFTIYQKWMSN